MSSESFFRGTLRTSPRRADTARLPGSRNSPSPAEATVSANLIDVRSLMERAQDGDPQAFRELHDRYAAPVRRFVASRVPDSLADDLTNETFLRAWRALTGFRWQDRDPLAWLLTIARNLIADHWSLLRNRLEVPSDDISPALHSSAPGAEDVVLDRAQAA